MKSSTAKQTRKWISPYLREWFPGDEGAPDHGLHAQVQRADGEGDEAECPAAAAAGEEQARQREGRLSPTDPQLPALQAQHHGSCRVRQLNAPTRHYLLHLIRSISIYKYEHTESQFNQQIQI